MKAKLFANPERVKAVIKALQQDLKRDREVVKECKEAIQAANNNTEVAQKQIEVFGMGKLTNAKLMWM